MLWPIRHPSAINKIDFDQVIIRIFAIHSTSDVRLTLTSTFVYEIGLFCGGNCENRELINTKVPDFYARGVVELPSFVLTLRDLQTCFNHEFPILRYGILAKYHEEK
jgi:hypothetical protein